MTRTATTLDRLLRPSPGERRATPAKRLAIGNVKAVVAACAIAVDLLIVLGFRDARYFDPDAVDAFAMIIFPLIAVDAALTFAFVRRNRGPAWLLEVTAVLDAVACMVFIQMTGTVSSYFLISAFMLIVVWRVFVDHRSGVVATLAVMIAHAVAFGLESAGVLRPASLFTADLGSVYSVPLFRIGAFMSLQTCFVIGFVAANATGRALHDKDDALSSARRHLERAAGEIQPGRYAGVVLADRYRIGELLGRGGMGEVYQAQRVDDDHDVAVKVLFSHLSEQPDLVERFQREIQAVSRLPSAFVAAVIDHGRTPDGTYFLVMELLRGEDLGTLLRRRGRLSPDELLPIVDQLAVVLGAAHRAGIIHRDLKPQNVFLVERDGARQVKLLDFGISRFVEQTTVTQTAAILGTPGYLAPEQVSPLLGEVGPRTDVFALGVVVYRAVTGQGAFLSPNAAAAIYEAVHVDPVAPSRLVSELPAALDDVLTIALAKRPGDRYADAAELAHDLRAAFNGTLSETVHARARGLQRVPVTPAATLVG